MSDFQEIGVVGAGAMGAALAAEFADAGATVTLLDVTQEIAIEGVARQIKTGGFLDPAAALRIRCGSTSNDMALLAQADWIIEAAAEKLGVKQAILTAIEAVRKPGSIVSSNTSTIPLKRLGDGLAPSLVADLVITHFFNPPRRMTLLEIVGENGCRREAVERIAGFGSDRIGKVVISCRDTPGFIANRLGNYWMAVVLNEAIRSGLPLEEVDAVTGRALGMPVGVFELLDLVGIDLLSLGWGSLQAELPADDALQAYPACPPLVAQMVRDNRLGQKTGIGFRRRNGDGALEALDLSGYVYRPAADTYAPAVEAAGGDLASMLDHDSPSGKFALATVLRMLVYAASLVPTVAESPEIVDRAMRYGYGWRQGPFAMIERLGRSWLTDRLQRQALTIPPRINAMRGGDGGGNIGLEKAAAIRPPLSE